MIEFAVRTEHSALSTQHSLLLWPTFLFLFIQTSPLETKPADEAIKTIEKQIVGKSSEPGDLAGLRAGMTTDQARQRLGQPNRVSRQILDRRYREQWFYDKPAGLWIEVDCQKGKDPHILTVHMPPSAPSK
jgi:hypothetical protein